MFQQVACGKRRTYVINKYGVLQVCNMLCLKSQGTILGLNLFAYLAGRLVSEPRKSNRR